MNKINLVGSGAAGENKVAAGGELVVFDISELAGGYEGAKNFDGHRQAARLGNVERAVADECNMAGRANGGDRKSAVLRRSGYLLDRAVHKPSVDGGVAQENDGVI